MVPDRACSLRGSDRVWRPREVVVVVVQTETEIVEGIGSDYAVKYGFSNPDEAGDYFFKSGRGISHEVVEAIAEHKNEPAWMRTVRHRALDLQRRSGGAPDDAEARPARLDIGRDAQGESPDGELDRALRVQREPGRPRLPRRVQPHARISPRLKRTNA